MEIKSIIDDNYYERLERAKIQGRNFYNSLDVKFKKLPININEIIEDDPNLSLYSGCLYGEDGYTLFIKNKKKYKICIESFSMAERKRFTTAHELGHIALRHFEKYSHKPLTDYEEYILDKEADMFAGEILMPLEYMVDYYDWSIEGLTCRFHVSKEAAKVRLHILKHDSLFLKKINNKNHSTSWSKLKEFNSIVENFYTEL